MDERPEGLILCGGRGRRFGGDKALASLGGIPILHRVAAALRPACCRVRLVSDGRPGFGDLGLETLVDGTPHAGPLAALADALPSVKADLCFVASCDMPFLLPAYFQLLRARIGDADACMPWWDGCRAPLAGLYRTRIAAERASELRRSGGVRLLDLVARLRLAALSEADLRAFAPGTLMNVNTPEEMARAAALSAASPAP